MLPKESDQGSESQHQLAVRPQLAQWATYSAIWEWDVEKKLFWSSPGNQRLFGRGDGEITESFDPEDDEDPWGSRLHPGDRARVLQSVRDHLKNDAPYDLEYRYLLPDGEYK